MTTGMGTVQVFDTNFLSFLYASRPSQWISKMKEREGNVFDRNILMFPFDARGHKSLFVVIGAANIRTYTARGFKGDRPCILHIDPSDSPSDRHDHHAVAEKLRTWLNRVWRWQHDDSDHLLFPFNKRSLPLSKTTGEFIPFFPCCCIKTEVASFLTCITAFVSEQCTTSKADGGLILLKYMSRISLMPMGSFSKDSFGSDGHNAAILKTNDIEWNSHDTKELRQDCSHLILAVAEKYNTVKNNIPRTKMRQRFEHDNNDIVDNDNTCSVCISDESTMPSEDSGSLFLPEEDDIEIDETDNIELSDNDSLIEECYSDFQNIDSPPSTSTDPDDNEKELVCPGDVIEYMENNADESIKKCSIVSIEEDNSTSTIILKNGEVLHPNTHSIRKIKMYSTMSRNLVPNPLAQWHYLNNCHLQSGSIQENVNGNRYVFKLAQLFKYNLFYFYNSMNAISITEVSVYGIIRD